MTLSPSALMAITNRYLPKFEFTELKRQQNFAFGNFHPTSSFRWVSGRASGVL